MKTKRNQKLIKPILLAALLLALSAAAQPTLTLNGTPGSVQHDWSSPLMTYSNQFQDVTGSALSFPFYINLTGVNTIVINWSAPPGEMFVVKAPPVALGSLNLAFGLTYQGGNESGLSLMGISTAFQMVYGSAPNNYGWPQISYNGLDFSVHATVNPGDASFAFTNLTLTVNLNGVNTSGLNLTPNGSGQYFAIYYGGSSADTNDPGPLLTLQPYSAAPPTPPALGIATYSNKPAVFFPTATGTNFVLQMTTNLASGNWVAVTNGVPFSCVVITNPPANAFFRLH
jgi:hypothetical protein